MLVLGAFLALFGPRLIPPLGLPAEGAPLRVMTINQMYSNRRIADLVAAIRVQGADIVAIQELSEPLAEAAGRELRDVYPYQLLATGRYPDGMGVLSRYPLRMATRTHGFVGQQMIVDMGGSPITLINVHLNAPKVVTRRLRQFRPMRVVLDYDTSLRARELPRLLREIDAIDGPLVVTGDFNTGDREPPYGELAARLRDAYRETAWGLGFTFPNDQRLGRFKVPFPVVRIDYVWSRGGIAPAMARAVCDSGGSDHCAVVADLRVRTAEALRALSPLNSALSAILSGSAIGRR
jgi:endonuclease/exonuclease/phosphatase (EEP) superfamily protein YafD